MPGPRRQPTLVRRLAVATTAGCLAASGAIVATAGSAAGSEPVAPGDPRITRLGTAPADYTLGDPHILVTRTGVTLVAWNQYQKVPNTIKVSRKKPGAKFSAVAVPRAGLETIGEPYLTEDTVNDRILLTAEAHGPTLDDLGLYVWTSRNNGASWSAPTKVWDSFASGQIALDRAGGFWAITDQTGVSVAHVPSSLATQHWPDDDIELSDRLGSRGAIDLASTGTMRRLLFGWGGGANDAWVHVGSGIGRADDVRVMTGLSADGATQVAGDREGAVLAAIRQVSTPGGNHSRLYAAGIVAKAATTQVYRPVLVSAKSEEVVTFAVNSIVSAKGKPTGKFAITWVDDRNRLRTSHSLRVGNPTWSDPKTVLTFPAQRYTFPGANDVARGWVALHAYNAALDEVQVAVPLG